MSSNKANGTLTSTTPVVVNMENIKFPCTVTLKSAAGGRLIQLSVDGGVEYFIPTLDQTTATMMALAVNAPVSHAKFTGQAGDTWMTL